MHKGLYLGSWAAGGIIIMIMLVSGWLAILAGNQELSADLYLYTLVPYTFTGIVWLLLLYRAWAAIQDGRSSVTPVKAVGLMLVPFYRYYWIFRVFGNYAGEFNAYINRHDLSVPNLSDDILMVFSILWIITGVLQSTIIGTFPQILLSGAYLAVGAMAVNTVCSGLDGLVAAQRDSERRAAAQAAGLCHYPG